MPGAQQPALRSDKSPERGEHRARVKVAEPAELKKKLKRCNICAGTTLLLLAGGRVYWAHLWQHQPEPTPAAFAPQASSGR
jgi:hypothetical protein